LKIIINQKTLAAKIGIAQRAVSSKTTVDLLKGLLLIAKNDQLKIKSSDSEIGIETYTQADVQQEGSIVVDSRLFGDIIRKLPDSLVELETDVDNNIYIYCVNSKFKIKGYSSNDFPILPEVDDATLCDLPQELLKNMIKQTVFAIAQDSAKPLLTGELLEISDQKINLVAVDGYRLAVRSAKFAQEGINAKVIIPGKTLVDVNSLLDGEENVRLGFNNKNAVFIIGETKITTRLLEGEFMNYKNLLPKEYNTKINLNTRDLLNSIERASLLSQTDKNNLIKFSIRDEIMAITSNTDVGNVYEEVAISLEGDYLDIAFNSRYLLEGVKNIDSEFVDIEFTKNINPCILKPSNDTDYTYLLLPVRLS
jgi:DNA polymerase-3 subunit beta